MAHPARWALVIASGAIVCTLCDHLHVAYAVLFYAHPAVWQQAWWVPLLFAVSTWSVIVGTTPTRALVGGDLGSPDVSARDIAMTSVSFVTAYAFTAVAHASPSFVLGVLVAWWASRLSRDTPRWLIVYSLIVGVTGPAVEATLSSLGLFTYLAPDFLGTPRWLPALYLHAGLAAGPIRKWVLAS